MPKPYLLLFVCLLPLFTLSAQTIEYTLTAAQEALQAEKYAEATTILDSLEYTGAVSPNFYLALGNARFGAGRFGTAILAYERGLRLRPGHRDLRNNLRFVREEAGITLPTLPDFFLLRWWRSLGAFLGTTTAYTISLVLWWLAVATGVYWLLRRRAMEEKRRFALLPLSFVLAGLAVAFYFLGSNRYAYLTNQDEAILTANQAILRVSPTPDGSVEAELEEGYKLFITDRTNNTYVKVLLLDGRQGYLPIEAIEVI